MRFLYRLVLRGAMLTGAGAFLAGVAATLYWAAAAGVSDLVLTGGTLMVASGMAAAACAMLLESAEADLARLRQERELLRAERDTYRNQALGLERRAENLSLVREIHRSTNIVTRGERLRQILSVLGQLGEHVEAAMFALAEASVDAAARAEDATRLRPVAYLKSGETGEAFLRFDRDFTEGSELSVADAVAVTSGLRRELAADIVADGESVGRIEAVTADCDEGPEETLLRLLGGADLGCEAAAAAVGHGQVLRAHDPAAGRVELTYPLTAGGAAVGALRVRLLTKEQGDVPSTEAALPVCLDGRGGTRSLGDLEEVLGECTRHVALALKKETDADRATTDGLTGLLMKREFDPRLAEALGLAAEKRAALGLMVIDVDHFKGVNDTHGHISGDIVLRGVGSLVRRHIRAPDSAFRYGGEEMCVVLPDSGARESKATAERLRAAVEAAVFSGDAGQEVRVTISVGVSVFDPRRSRAARPRVPSPAELFRRADAAVYVAKGAGRNQVVTWNRRMRARPGSKMKAKTPCSRGERRISAPRAAGRGSTKRKRTAAAAAAPGSASSAPRVRKSA